MPRVYVRKTQRQTWTDEQMSAAKRSVDSGMSVRSASAKFNIPRITLARWIASPQKERGLGSEKPVFTREQAAHLLDLEARFYGITMLDVRKFAYELAEKNNLEHNFNHKLKMAERYWLEGFLRRNPILSFRKPEATSAARARGFNKPSVDAFFNLLRGVLDEKNFPPSRIYNADETGISTVPPKKLKIAARKGKKQVGSITSGERGLLTTVVMCMSAVGKHLPPYVIFPRVRMHDSLKKGAPNGTKFNCNPSGYMNSDTFLDWFDHFIAHVNPTEKNPALLIIDGHSSHTRNLAFVEKAHDNFVTVTVLPPHCSHKMQPLDVAFMGPFKSYYARATEDFMRKFPGKVISLYDISELLAVSFQKAASVDVAVNGFLKTGIWPCNRDVFSDEDFAPSEVTDQPESVTFITVTDPMVIDEATVQQVSLPSEIVFSRLAANQLTENSPLMNFNQICHIEPICETSANSSFNISPVKILPRPIMAAPRVTKRKQKSEQAVEITAENYRQALATSEASHTIKEIKKRTKASAEKAS